jgi:flagellin-like hook-associated protein FlgL
MIINSSSISAAAMNPLNNNQAGLDKTHSRPDALVNSDASANDSGDGSLLAEGISSTQTNGFQSLPILDLDSAWQTVAFASKSILSDPGAAIRAQANQPTQSILNLLA